MSLRTVILAGMLAAVCLLVFAERAEARRRGIVVINYGDKFLAEQSIPKEIKDQAPEMKKLAYHCQHFGILWLTLWTWDGKWCVHNDVDSYIELPDEVAAEALGKSGGSPGKPFFYRFPFGLFLSLVALAGWTVYESVNRKITSGGKPPRRAPTPFDDDAEPMLEVDDASQKQAAIEEHIAKLLEEGNANDAHRLYVNSCAKMGEWDLSEKNSMGLILALDRAKRHQDAMPLMLRYVEINPNAPIRFRLKLAQLLLTVDVRPVKAIEVLDTVDTTALDAKTQQIVAKLRTKADQIAASEDSELRLADD